MAATIKFVGVDGEGITDSDGHHQYVMLRVGDLLLYKDNASLSPLDIFNFLADLPLDATYVGFFLGYDYTMWCKGLPPDFNAKLFATTASDEFISVPGSNIECCLIGGCMEIRRKIGRGRYTRKIRIWDTKGFFQGSFMSAISTWGIGSEAEHNFIERMKKSRSDFTGTPEEIAYNKLECELLSKLMHKFYDAALQAGLKLEVFYGAGSLATAMLKANKVKEYAKMNIPDFAQKMGQASFYGGRFEYTLKGHIKRKVYEYDINSAYPYVYRDLPCISCGKWVKKADATKFGFSEIKFTAPKKALFGLFPVRDKNGAITYPITGDGYYTNREIQSALKNNWRIEFISGCHYVGKCTHRPHAFIDQMYALRRKFGKNGPGIVIKLAMNSIYGKNAQTRPLPGKFTNFIYASYMTGATRAMLYDAAMLSPKDIVMFATDAVYSFTPLKLNMSDSVLGAWDASHYDDLVIMQSGVYFSPSSDTCKTRGISKKIFAEYRGDILAGLAVGETDFTIGGVNKFISHRSAIARGKPELGGEWVEETRKISLLDKKRIIMDDLTTRPHHGKYTRSYPYVISVDAESKLYSDKVERGEQYDDVDW